MGSFKVTVSVLRATKQLLKNNQAGIFCLYANTNVIIKCGLCLLSNYLLVSYLISEQVRSDLFCLSETCLQPRCINPQYDSQQYGKHGQIQSLFIHKDKIIRLKQTSCFSTNFSNSSIPQNSICCLILLDSDQQPSSLASFQYWTFIICQYLCLNDESMWWYKPRSWVYNSQ